MVDDTITDGKRIAQLLSSEVTGREIGQLSAMAVVDADPDVEATADGALAYRIEHDGERVADVFVQPERARLELSAGVETGAEVAADADAALRVRPKATEPPRTLVFVESGAAVKAAVDVLVAAAEDG